MTSKRLYQIFVAVIAILAIGLTATAHVFKGSLQERGLDLKSQRQQIAVLNGQQEALKKAKADIAEYKDLAKIAKTIVPQDKSQAQTTREIVNIAAEHGITIGSITFPQSNLGAVGTRSVELSQLEAVPGIPGVVSLQITVTSGQDNTVPYFQFINFLQGLEQNRRTALVKQISLTPDEENPSEVSFSIVLEEYIEP